jgi:hypothetical protein
VQEEPPVEGVSRKVNREDSRGHFRGTFYRSRVMPVHAMRRLWIFCRSPACRVDRGGQAMVKCGWYPIYDLCLLMHLPRLETSGGRWRRLTSCAGIPIAARATRAQRKRGHAPRGDCQCMMALPAG